MRVFVVLGDSSGTLHSSCDELIGVFTTATAAHEAGEREGGYEFVVLEATLQ